MNKETIADLVKAWADGAVIQVRGPTDSDSWCDCGPVGSASPPQWAPGAQYRRKPWDAALYLPVLGPDNLFMPCSANDKAEAKRRYPNARKVLKVVINPSDMTLVSADLEDV